MVDSVNNINNIQNISAKTTVNNISSGTIINSPPGIQAANLGWVQASLSNILQDGSLNLRTPMGSLIVRVPNNKFNVGDGISFRFDLNGKILLKPEFNVVNTINKATVPVQTGTSPLNNISSIGNLLGIASLDPVKPVLPNALAEINTNKFISSIVPHMNSASFAFAASLFPMVVRGGVISKSVINQEGRLQSQSRLLEVAEKLLITPAPRIEGSLGWTGWNMPFFESGRTIDTKWLYREEENLHPEKDSNVKHTIVEIDLDFCGKTQVSCLADELSVDIQVISTLEIENELQNEISETLHLIGNILNYHIRIEFLNGAENLLNIVNN